MEMSLQDRVAVITGAGGAIGGEIARLFVQAGASVALWDLSHEAAMRKCDDIAAGSAAAEAFVCDVTNREQVKTAVSATLQRFGAIDILVNGAGGSRAGATTSPDLPFFDLLPEDMLSTLSLNYLSAVLPCQEVGRVFAERKSGVVINITSIAGDRPLSRAVTYSNAKAAADSFTRWLAVHMAREYAPGIRVNAIAPGFVLTEQNRFLLTDAETGGLSPRGEHILRQVPAGRFGDAAEIAGAALWLASDLARFVTGAVIPVDGGFTAESGV